MFGKIIIPKEVFEEVTVRGAGMPGSDEIKGADWVEVKHCTDINLLRAMMLQVDPGEAEAIVLGLELEADLLLIDDRTGRKLAKEFELPIMGLLGVICAGKQKGLLESIKPVLDLLVYKAGFRISKDLYDEILKNAGET